MTSMECSDGDGQCECPQCAKLGSISDRVFGLANEVAREVRKELPGRMVGCLAYNQHSEPPSMELEPNLYVQLCAGFIRGPYSHEQLLDLWPKKCQNLGFYEYFSVWLWDFDRLPGGNAANLKYFRERIRRYRDAGATSIDAESGNNWGVHGRGYYLAARLMWNPDADVNALLADFYEKAFGPAAPAMRRYYERIAAENEPLLSRGLLGEALRDVDEAARLAQDRPDVLARLDQLKHYLRYVHLRWLIDHETDKAKRKDLSVAALTLVYRTRYEYMNHWAAMRTTWAEALSKEYDEPAWRFNDRGPKPWIVDTPVGRAETDRWFREAPGVFPTDADPGNEVLRRSRAHGVCRRPARHRSPKRKRDRHFCHSPARHRSPSASEVGHTVSRRPAIEARRQARQALLSFVVPPPLQQMYQRPATYALCSRQGEPLDIEITPGTIAWYRDRADARYWLRDAEPAGRGRGPL